MDSGKHEIIKGLMCPGCGGTVELKEGNNVLKCTYCEIPLLVMGDEGVIQYYVKSKVNETDTKAVAKNWFGKFDKDRKLKTGAEFTEIFLVHLPFWRSIGQVCGWIFGNKIHHETHRDNKGNMHTTTRKEPVERMIMKEYIWNKAACDVSEFGVEEIDNSGISGNLEPFDISTVEKQGMVFEPMHSRTDAVLESENWMLGQAKRSVDIDEVTFQKLHSIGKKLSVIYYPLWIVRYKFKDRNYQLVIDGLHNKLLYGRAPGSTIYRVSMFIASLMIGNLILTTSLRLFSEGSNELIIAGAIAGIALIIFGFSKFRYGGEVIEGKTTGLKAKGLQETFNSLKEIGFDKYTGMR
ncbi:hypothetical protein METP2_03085 [Methanosarcinales archaeon]|nr:hypothetical protein METP2_03085 [Methanosarcinales archaeon]